MLREKVQVVPTDVIGDTVPHPIRPRTAIVQRLWPAGLILIGWSNNPTCRFVAR